MRLLGGLGLVAPVAFSALFMMVPTAVDSWVDEGVRSILAAVVAAAAGVSLTALLMLVYVPFRMRRLVKAAEQLAAGTLGVAVDAPPRGRGFERRLARAM